MRDLQGQNALVTGASGGSGATSPPPWPLRVPTLRSRAETQPRWSVPGMLERGSGHVVNIGSLAGKGALPYRVPYAAAKWGLAGLTQSLRAEYAGSGVGFSLVIPGFFTEDGIFARHEADGVKAPVMFGTTTPERVARAVVRAIAENAPEIIVTPRPLRPLLAFADLAPRLAERLAAELGASNASRTVAQLNGRLSPPRLGNDGHAQ